MRILAEDTLCWRSDKDGCCPREMPFGSVPFRRRKKGAWGRTTPFAPTSSSRSTARRTTTGDHNEWGPLMGVSFLPKIKVGTGLSLHWLDHPWIGWPMALVASSRLQHAVNWTLNEILLWYH